MGAVLFSPGPTRRLVRWLHRQLFSSLSNTLLTLAGVLLLWLVLPALLDWAWFSATFAGDSAAACNDEGACWVFVTENLTRFVYGFYPQGELWRVNLGVGLVVPGLWWLFAPRGCRLPALLYLLLLYPVIAWYLFRGGVLGLAPVATEQWGGLFLTLVIAGVGIAAALPLGILLALARRSRLPVVRWLATAFIEFWRGVPLIMVLFMASVMLPLFLPAGMSVDKLLRALVGVALFASAYMAEVVRGGLQGVARGQYEAAAALGLGYWRALAWVILPQALGKVIPGIVNTFIALFKDTTLVLIIGLFDLLGIVQAVATDPQWLGYVVEGYVFAGALFWLFCYGMSRLSQRVERQKGGVDA